MPVVRLSSDEFGNRRVTNTVSAAGKVASRSQRSHASLQSPPPQNSPGTYRVAGTDPYGRAIISQGTASTRTLEVANEDTGYVPGLQVEAHFSETSGNNRIGRGEIPRPKESGFEIVLNGEDTIQRQPPTAFEEQLDPIVNLGGDACDVSTGGAPPSNVIVIREDNEPQDNDPQDINDVDPNLDPCQDGPQTNVWLPENEEPTWPSTREGCYEKPETGLISCLWIPDDPSDPTIDTSASQSCDTFVTTYDCDMATTQCLPVDGEGGEFSELSACQAACQEPALPTENGVYLYAEIRVYDPVISSGNQTRSQTWDVGPNGVIDYLDIPLGSPTRNAQFWQTSSALDWDDATTAVDAYFQLSTDPNQASVATGGACRYVTQSIQGLDRAQLITCLAAQYPGECAAAGNPVDCDKTSQEIGALVDNLASQTSGNIV